MTRLLSLTLAALLLVLTAGCNAFGVEGEGASDDPAILLEDAQAALDRGEPEKAEAQEQLLEESTAARKALKAQLALMVLIFLSTGFCTPIIMMQELLKT